MQFVSRLIRVPFPPPKEAGANFALHRAERGFTLVEVAVSLGMIILGLSGVYALQAHTLQITRSIRDSSAASQILQQRVEQLRMAPYEVITTASGLASLMQSAEGATQSEREMAAVRNVREIVAISTCPRPGVTPPASQSFSVTRIRGSAAASSATANLAGESQVKARLLVTWEDRAGSHRREFTTVFSKGGLSSDGITLRVERATTAYAGPIAPPPPSADPLPPPVVVPPVVPPAPPPTNPTVCRHNRPWPHCGTP